MLQFNSEIRRSLGFFSLVLATPTTSALEAAAMTMQQRGERHVERMAGISERCVNYIVTMNGHEIRNSVDRIEKLDKIASRTYRLNDDIPHEGFTLNVLSLGSMGIELRPRKDNLS